MITIWKILAKTCIWLDCKMVDVRENYNESTNEYNENANYTSLQFLA